MRIYVVLLYYGLLCCWTYLATGQQCTAPTHPKAIYSKARLPYGADYGMSLHYDGDDSIYVFSRSMDGIIYSFNVSSGMIDILGPIPFQGMYAPVVSSKDGGILYFGNDPAAQRVFKFDKDSKSGTIVAELPFTLSPIRSVFPSASDPNKIYLVEPTGTSINIHELDTTSYCITLVISIPGNSVLPAVTAGEYAYIFSAGRITNTTRIHRDSLQVTFLGETKEPLYIDEGVTVATSKYAYALGRSHVPLVMNQYHPEDNIFTQIPIEDLPSSSRPYDYPSMVFVEKWNRIYFFGASKYICHVDLSTME